MDEEKRRLGAVAVRQVRAAVDESTALRLLARGWWRSVAARLRGAQAPVKSECVWAPVYLVSIPLVERGVLTHFQCSVDGLSGAFALFGMSEAIDSVPGATGQMPPELSAKEAEAVARASFVAAILRRRRKSATAQLGDTESVELLRWPYWVFYYRRRNGAMDIAVVDAATGDRAGHKIKLGLLRAFCAAADGEAASERK